jgi:hypothetical protein
MENVTVSAKGKTAAVSADEKLTRTGAAGADGKLPGVSALKLGGGREAPTAR